MSKAIRFFATILMAWYTGVFNARSEQDLSREYHTFKWQIEDGLPQNSVRYITQTADGYLWVATPDALARFDGRQFKVFSRGEIPELGAYPIRCLYGDREGRLWIGFHEHLVCYANGKFTVYATPEGHSLGEFNSVAEDSSGGLYALAWVGFCRIDVDRGRLDFLPNPAGANGGAKTIAGRNGDIWVASGNSLYRFQKDRWTLEATLPFIIASFYVDSDGTIWCGLIGGGFVHIEANGAQQFSYVGPGGIYGIVRSSKSGFLLRMEYDLFRLSPTEKVRLSLPNGKQLGAIFDIYKDREGNIWLGTDRDGLVMLRWNSLQTSALDDGLPYSHVTSIVQAKQNQTIIGTMGGGLRSFENGAWKNLDLLAWRDIGSLCETRDGSLWIGTFGRHLWRARGGQAVLETQSRALASRTLFESRNGSLWIGGDGMGVECLINGSVTRFDSNNGLLNEQARCFTEDKAGAIWVGTSKGLYRISSSQVHGYFARDGLGADSILSLFADSGGLLWIGTAGGGLTRYRDGRFATMNVQQGLLDNFVTQILEDDFGYLWLGSNRGLFRASLADLHDVLDGHAKRIYGRSFGKSDGMRNLECTSGFQPSCMKASDGRLWFGTVDGVVIADPKATPISRVPPLVHIQRVIADGLELAAEPSVGEAHGPKPSDRAGNAKSVARLSAQSLISIPPGTKRIELHYTGISFSAIESVRFKYRLENYDKDWNEADTLRVASYTHVPPGDYVFRVQASNGDGVWNPKAAQLAFHVAPQFWQTWWFRIGLGMAIVALASGVSYAIIHRRRQMESLRLRIARDLHDEVGSHLGTISLYNQLAQSKAQRHESSAGELEEIDRVVQRTAQSLRDVIWFINPEFDTLDGMVQHMEDAASRGLAGKAVVFHVNLPERPRRLAVQFRRNMYFIFRELIHNIVKHSRAKRVEIAISEEKKTFIFQLSEDGIGFDPNTIRKGHGLKNMRERAAELGGRLEIQSNYGQGMKVRLEVPLT